MDVRACARACACFVSRSEEESSEEEEESGEEEEGVGDDAGEELADECIFAFSLSFHLFLRLHLFFSYI